MTARHQVSRVEPQQLYASPNALAPHYSRFRVAERLLLTGHSHQAWPDCGFRGQVRAWEDAAEHLDGKWERAFAKASRVRAAWKRLLDDPEGHVALGANTHELVVQFLSALPLRRRPVIVTTDGEFHTLRRQLDRLGEAGLEIRKIASHPITDLAARLAASVDDRTAAIAVSAVMFRSGRIVPELGDVAAACEQVGAQLLVDAYHALNVVPFSVRELGLERAFVVGGGYKYCQLGEGNCFLRFPSECRLRPVVTGWFSEFASLAKDPHEEVVYGEGAARFAGATYDPTSHYRAVEVFEFFDRTGLDPATLRRVSQHQMRLLADRFDALDLDPELVGRDRDLPIEQIGGFLCLRSPQAARISAGLLQRGVSTDSRDSILRLGPAPYLSDDQIGAAIAALGEVVRELHS